MLPLALVLAAFLAPAGQAHSASERSPEEETLAASKEAAKAAEKEERMATKKAQRELEAQRKLERASARKAPGSVASKTRSDERENVVVVISCTQVSWTYTKFNEGKNTVTEQLKIDRKKLPPTTFSFDGSDGSHTTAIAVDAPPGSYIIDAWGKWGKSMTSGPHKGFDIHVKPTCAPVPALSIEKLQRIEGGSGSYTTARLTGETGQTIDYEILASNTGNVPVTLGTFTDPRCDSGTISGGPIGGVLAVGASGTYLCKHLLGKADQSAGSYSNVVTLTGTPPVGEGSPVTHTSNTVVTEAKAPPAPALSIEKLQRIEGGSGSYTTARLTGETGQTIDYEILASNTGNVPLSLGTSFTDSRCDSGTISGGPIGGVLAVGASGTYLCEHLLGKADQSAGSYSNVVTLTGTPPVGEGSPVTHTSNTVVTEVKPPPASSGTSGTGGGGGGGGLTTSPFTGTQTPQSGILAFASAAVPALKGPRGCVRSSFHATVKSAGVASVTFYLDGHKLKTLTAKNARKGLLTLAINPTKLSVGAHRLMAKITMARTASSTRPAHASRTLTVLRCRSAVLTPKLTG
jgi:uncharacterized repeat protein (TIGR01451 family)